MKEIIRKHFGGNLSVSCNIPVGLPMDLRLFENKNNKINVSPNSIKVTSKQLLIPLLIPEHLRNLEILKMFQKNFMKII